MTSTTTLAELLTANGITLPAELVEKENDYSDSSGSTENIPIPKMAGTAKKEQQSLFTLGNFMTVTGILLGFLMLYLLVFVDETAAAASAPRRGPRRRPRRLKSYKPKAFEFKYTQEKDLDAMTELLGSDDDELKMVVFDYSEDPPERPGRAPIKPRYLWKRYERIAKGMRTKALFKRYDDEDLPEVIRFDCGEAGQLLCDKMVGDQAPAAVLLKNRRPRAIPDEVRSDKQVLQFLYDQMQPAVKYLETVDDVEEFTEGEGIRVMFYGNEREPLAAFSAAADALREYATFGRTRDQDAIAKFADGATDVVVRLYRKFDDSPIDYAGELNEASIGEFAGFVRTEGLPLFAEFQGNELRDYEKRGLPIVFLQLDSTEDETERILKDAREIATELRGKFSMAWLDGVVNKANAERLGFDAMPQILIRKGGVEPVKLAVDVDAPRTSLREAVERFMAKTEGRTVPVADDDEDDNDYYDDEDVEDDEDLAGTDEAGDEEEEEEDEKEL